MRDTLLQNTPQREYLHAFPNQSSMPAGEILFVICALSCVIGEIAIIRSAIKTSKLPLPAGATRAGEIAWSIVPAIALGFLLFATFGALRAN
jgi:hypothetical protein